MVKLRKCVLLGGALVFCVFLLIGRFPSTAQKEERQKPIEGLRIETSEGKVEMDFSTGVGPLYYRLKRGTGTQYVSKKGVDAVGYRGKPAKLAIEFWKELPGKPKPVYDLVFKMALTVNKQATFWDEVGAKHVLVIDTQGRWP